MAESTIAVTLCWSLAARDVQETSLRVPEGSTVEVLLHLAIRQIVESASSTVDASQQALSSLHFQQPGVWGKKVSWSHRVKEGDRVELYRPLQVDPKVARRQRFKRQGKGRTGLFANRKSGSAAGY
ncbi:MAG: RnfH family protein [Limnohabitans sp.]|jgi:putative ubiquitin-RnfH superfamily antitoxin RatB of RatAB toxin-antitoxin module